MYYIKRGAMYLQEVGEGWTDWTAFRDLAQGFKSKSTAERTARKVRSVFGLYIAKE